MIEQEDNILRGQISLIFTVVFKRAPSAEEIEERFKIIRGGQDDRVRHGSA